LLRVIAQRGAEQLPLPESAVREGHGVQRDSRALAAKGRAALVAALGTRTNWVDRFLVAPLAKLALPPLVARGVPPVALAGLGGVFGISGLAAIAIGWTASGMAAIVLALALLALADVLAWLRDERALGTILHWSAPATVALATLLLGQRVGFLAASATPPLLALTTVLAGALAERTAAAVTRPWWWAVPAAYPLILLPATLIGYPVWGLAAAASYAVVTLGFGVEALRARIGG
jgi:hypothetical protein